MNLKAITFHSCLEAWGDQPTNIPPNKYNGGTVHLSPQKFVHIDSWRKEVNKNFKKTSHPVKFPAFMRLSASTYHRSNPKIPTESHKSRSVKPRFKSANAQWGLTQNNSTSLATRLASISIHYSSNRKELHENEPPLIKSIVIENNGYHATEDKTDVTATKIQSWGHNLSCANIVSPRGDFDTERRAVNEDCSPTHNRPHPHNKTNTQLGSKKQSLESITNGNSGRGKSQQGENSDALSYTLLSISADFSDQGSELSMSDSDESIQSVPVMRVSNRSTSNNLLNVVSIDDCKMACRYRPCIFKEKQRGMQIHGWSRENTKGDTEIQCETPLTASGESYGRNTALYTTTESSSTHVTEKSGRKRMKTAVNTTFKDRCRVNTPCSRLDGGEKNFSERQIGSATFQRLNATLRRHISDMMEKKSQEKTRLYRERKKRSAENCGIKVVSEELRKI